MTTLVPYRFKTALKTSCFVVVPGNPSVEAASKAFYNVCFFYWVVGKAHFGLLNNEGLTLRPFPKEEQH